MIKPIILWQSERTESTDDAGTTILSLIGPPNAYFQPGPYSDKDNAGHIADPEICVPPLSYFCIKRLVQAPESVYHYGSPRPYHPPESSNDPDILQSLIPRNTQGNFNLGKVDPRLWAILVQTYSDLPDGLRTYCTALSDKYLPLLQRVPTTEHFSLLTVLELPGCSHLNDDTIIHLTPLHTLCVLDASHTSLSALGIRRLSGTVKWVEDGVDCANRRRGPWQLRILSLHHCRRVTNAIFQYLESFILLAAVDLRGTSCTWDREKIPPSFFPAVEKRLYHPTRPLEALSLLLNSQGVIPSSYSGILHIDRLTHANHGRSRNFGNLSDIRSPIVAEDPNMASLACRMANPTNLETSQYSPERVSGLQRLSHSHPLNELRRSSTEPGVTTLQTLHDVVAAESDAYAARHKAELFYSQKAVTISSSMAHPPRRMPQWGQELLMLYRDPPPWSQAQIPPIVKVPSRPPDLKDLVSIDRTNERAMKGVQEMRDMLSERHRSIKETDGSCDNVKASTRLPASRNPFAVRSGESSAPVHHRANEEALTPLRADTATKSTVVKPMSLRSLRPITSLPIPIPPDSSRPVSVNQGLDSEPAPCGRWRCYDSNKNSLRINGIREQKADMSLVCTIGRRGTVRAGPTARKRMRIADDVGGSKKQEERSTTEIDWSSWGTRSGTIAPG